MDDGAGFLFWAVGFLLAAFSLLALRSFSIFFILNS